MRVRLRLGEILRQHGISGYRLAKAVGGRVSRNTIYAWLREEPPKCLELTTLEAILTALRELTGRAYGVGDLLTLEE